jgi:hypothetical protein
MIYYRFGNYGVPARNTQVWLAARETLPVKSLENTSTISEPMNL